MNKIIILVALILSEKSFSQWERSTPIKAPRDNIYQLERSLFEEKVEKGKTHALFYPVTSTELVIPFKPLMTFLDLPPENRIKKEIFRLMKNVAPFKNSRELYSWLGLHDFPIETQPESPNTLPDLSRDEILRPMGVTIFQKNKTDVLTFSCAACHSADLFGVKIIGLTNRFPRANEFFRRGSDLAPYLNTFLFKKVLKTTEKERVIMLHSKRALTFVGSKKPVVLGLDTSLAQVALSLSKRREDEWATKDEISRRFPRKNKLETLVSDSKPAVWWNLKYKNRWLSDGSIVSGNPVHTNFLWNEIGRGADLKVLEAWLIEHQETIDELTAAVFASKPPSYVDFFGVDSLDLEKAKRGQVHYVQSCQKCHGSYTKGWDVLSNEQPKKELLATINMTYHEQTPVKDVGTDPGRYLGMREFSDDLNRLNISKTIGTIVEPQKGYVPPPLDGIWSRWPFFHNNSIPNLCALLTVSSQRPKTYWAGEAKDKVVDFDQDCVGYPVGDKTPAKWKKDADYFYDTSKEGLSNAGHDDRILTVDGKEIYTQQEKNELIEFLKTL